MKKLKIIFFGNPHFVIPIVDKIAIEFSLLGVVTNPDQKIGRKHVLTPTPVKIRAQEIQVAQFSPEKLDQSVAKKLHKIKPDLFIVSAYGKIIPKFVLDIPKYGSINIHPSLLPKYRGATPIQAAILNSDRISGISIYKMDEKLDHGPLLYQEEIALSEEDTFESLSIKMFQHAAGIFTQIIENYTKGNINPKAQEDDKATYCKVLTKQNGFFDISNPPKNLDQMIRAYYPWPTVWTVWNAKIVKFLPKGLIQLEGKKAIPFASFLNGYPDFPLKSFIPGY